jgi:hypothetical protein
MKNTKLILALLALMPFARAFAQEGEIIYRDFEPDSILVFWVGNPTMSIDLEGNGVSDIEFFYELGPIGVVFPYIRSLYPDNLEFCITEPNSILTDIEDWYSFLDWRVVRDNDCYGFRFKHDEGMIYGWFETYVRAIEEGERRIVHWGFDRTAYCTIPNYPIHWGETMIIGIEEDNEVSAFATVYPNPTTGLVTIYGKNLKQTEVVNMFGQVVASAQNKGNSLTVDIGAMPDGVYFLTVTDEAGRKCTRKVVKE